VLAVPFDRTAHGFSNTPGADRIVAIQQVINVFVIEVTAMLGMAAWREACEDRCSTAAVALFGTPAVIRAEA
jgi:hypothetical protein